MATEPPVKHGLYFNENGPGYVIRQSDLSAWMRCNLQKHYYDEAKVDPTATQPKALSRTVWGTLLHHVIQVMEEMHFRGQDQVLETAQATFLHYWKPENLPQIAEPIEEWIAKDTYGGLRDRGLVVIAQYYDLLKRDTSNLLALEYPFAVPIETDDGRIHTLVGTIDRLSLRTKYTKPYISIDDWKSGKQPTWLRYSVQGTAYCYATTQPEFWLPLEAAGLEGFPPETLAALEEVFARRRQLLHAGSPEPKKGSIGLAPRGFRWINLPEGKHSDGGFRVEQDYARLRLACREYVRANEAQIYMPTMNGDTCKWCPFRDNCGGIGFPDEEAGRP